MKRCDLHMSPTLLPPGCRADCNRQAAELSQARRKLAAAQEAQRPLQAQIHRLQVSTQTRGPQLLSE